MRPLFTRSRRTAFVVALSLALVLSLGPAARAQGRQTGILRGSAQDETGGVLPGVTVAVTSDALQGTRVTVTDANGDYELPGLPNGRYAVTFALEGFQSVEQTVLVPLGGAVEVSVTMPLATRPRFEVQVVAVAPTPLASTEVSQNITVDEVNALPMGRDPFRIAELAPGLTDNTPNARQVTIGGAFAYDNVFLIDGVDTNDNVFGNSNSLFIEDAIEETQVLTSAISAEYGRFSGGVINVVTKSGGNAFSGSLRVNMNDPNWVARTPFEVERGNQRTGTLANNTNYETTVGGPIVLDRLWFFYANRTQREKGQDTLPRTGIPFERKTNNDRNQIKLTGTLAQGHTLEGTYMRNSTSQTSPTLPFTIDPAAIISPTVPNELWVLTYRGAATPRLFAEFQVSRRTWGRRGVGGTSTAIVDSPFLSVSQGLEQYNAPFFDATDPEDRNNRQFTGSATYMLPTVAGTHSIKGGFEHFRSTRIGGNSQSATGYYFLASYASGADGRPLLDGGRLVPIFAPGRTILFTSIPVRNATIDLDTLSFYVNDTWTLDDHWTFNLGVRSETVDSSATGGIKGVDTSMVAPRLAVSYDPHGDGRYTIQSSYSHYSGNYNVTQFADNTNVGNPDELTGIYIGPPGQGLGFEPGFNPDNYLTVDGDFPTRNVFFDEGIHSPLTKEFTLAVGTGFGPRGYAKITYVNRRASQFVEDFLDLTTGSTTIIEDGRNFGTFTNQVFSNTDALKRDYDAIEVQTRMQVTDDFLVDGTYTVQLQNDGNFEGEATSQPAISSPAFDFPEITPEARYFPSGRLDDFQRHKLRVWGIYNLELGAFGDLDIGGVWRVNSGLTYSLVSQGVGLTPTQAQILDTLGYASSPGTRPIYYAAGRGSESFAGYGLFDLSLTYQIPVWHTLRPWVKADIYNLFNNDKQIAWDTTVIPDPNGPVDDLGIPTRYTKGPGFGQATSPGDYPAYLPGLDGLRAFQLAVGFRF